MQARLFLRYSKRLFIKMCILFLRKTKSYTQVNMAFEKNRSTVLYHLSYISAILSRSVYILKTVKHILLGAYPRQDVAAQIRLLLSCPSHNFPHLRAHAIARSVTVVRSSAVQASSSRRQERRWGPRLWLPAVAIHRLGVVEVAPSPHHCFRTAHPCAQSVKGSPTEPVLQIQPAKTRPPPDSHVDGGWHVCQAVFPEPQSAVACRRVERCDCAHEALPRLQSASSWLVMEQLWSGVFRLSCIHVNPPSFVRSLRHFGMDENLRPGDENLRHLTITSS